MYKKNRNREELGRQRRFYTRIEKISPTLTLSYHFQQPRSIQNNRIEYFCRGIMKCHFGHLRLLFGQCSVWLCVRGWSGRLEGTYAIVAITLWQLSMLWPSATRTKGDWHASLTAIGKYNDDYGNVNNSIPTNNTDNNINNNSDRIIMTTITKATSAIIVIAPSYHQHINEY